MHDVIAIGGNSLPKGFLTPIQRYMLEVTGVARPRVCFIPTASGDAAEAIANFYSAFDRSVCDPIHLGLFQNTTTDIPALLGEQHLIYVGGGNTRNLLLLWRAWGVDAAIRAAWDSGAVIGGPSAGGLCWFESGITDSYAGEFRDLSCLGWVPGSFCPHYDSEPGRQPVVDRLIADGKMPAGYAVEDDAAIHLREGSLARIVTQRDGAGAYTMRADNGKTVLDRLAN